MTKEQSTTIAERLLDPELRPLLSDFQPRTFTRETLSDIRSGVVEMLLKSQASLDTDVVVEEIIVQSKSSPAVRVLRYRPAHVTRSIPAILHIHGGGFVLGLSGMSDAANRRIAAELTCQIFSVDYRLAPETAFPGALDDCFAVLEWLHKEARRLLVDPRRIGVKGESAGGGLAGALALLTRDRSGPHLAFQHLTYPMLDDRTCIRRDLPAFAGAFGWTQDNNTFGWASLLGHDPGSADVSPYAAPAREIDLAGLPATYIAVGGLDLFLEENLAYAGRLSRAAVAVEFHVYPGAFHGFDMAQEARVSIAATRDSRAALHRMLNG